MAPLIDSANPKVLHKNANIEMAHGKPRDQAYAIAYSTQRQAAKKQGKATMPGPKR